MSAEDDIVAAAHRWIGTPYKHAGRSRFGLDCAGLIVKVMNELGFTDYDTTNYPKRPVPEVFLREMKTHLRRVDHSELGHGAVVAMREPKHPCHTGIIEVDGDGRMWLIHATARARKVVREPVTQQRMDGIIMVFKYNVPEGYSNG